MPNIPKIPMTPLKRSVVVPGSNFDFYQEFPPLTKPKLKIQGGLSQIYIPGIKRRLQLDDDKIDEIKQK